MSGAGLKMPIHALEMKVLEDMMSSMGSSNNETREITSYDIQYVNIGLPVEAQCDPRCSKVQKQEKQTSPKKLKHSHWTIPITYRKYEPV